VAEAGEPAGDRIVQGTRCRQPDASAQRRGESPRRDHCLDREPRPGGGLRGAPARHPGGDLHLGSGPDQQAAGDPRSGRRGGRSWGELRRGLPALVTAGGGARTGPHRGV
jgi:hypothetical protein